MALSASFNGTNITTADSTTGWGNNTITAAEAWTVEVVHQGSAAIGFQASNKDGMGYFTYGSTLNFNTTYAGQHIFMWVNVTMPGTMEALSTGGLYLLVGSSSSDYKKFQVAAKDYREVMEKGFIRFVLDPSKTATESSGTPDMTAINTFGVWIDTDEAARIDQLFIDRIDVGWGIEVTGTSSDFWNDLVAEDVGLNSGTRDNMYGIVQEYNGVYFCYGQIKIGDDTGTLSTAVSDSGKTVKFVSQQYYNGSAWVDMVADNFFKIELVDNATGSTQFTDGVVVGTDNGRAGSSISGSALHDTELDCETNLTNASSFVKLYATQLLDFRAGIKFHSHTDSLFYGGVVSRCGQFDPGVAKVRNIIFSETSPVSAAHSAALLWNSSIDIQDCSFIANIDTDGTYIGHGIEHPAAGSFTYTNLVFSGNEKDIWFSATSGDLTVSKSGTSNPSTTNNTNDSSGSLTVQGSVPLTITVVNSSNAAITTAAVRIEETDGTLVSQGAVNGSGIYSSSFSGSTPLTVVLKVRSSSSGEPSLDQCH